VSRKQRRSFTRAFKLSALARMAATENIRALARELGIERKLLYCWRDQHAGGGAAALRRAGRPSAAELAADEAEVPAAASMPDASRQIAALERKIGQQQLDLDFFRAALRHVRERRRSNGAPGATASTRRPTR
jgi:transposase